MTLINEEINHSEEYHQYKIDEISKTIRKIAFKKGERTKLFQGSDEVEVVSQKYGFIGSYCTATIISSIDANHYRVKYKTLLTNHKSAPLEEIVKGYEVCPKPPNLPERMSEKEFCLYDRVDVFANDG
ncbi:hypothetical protein BC332_01493 [Capsicum chinense]|nr:hypothetical protein BC332_01493 [Capsicum chinense]